MQNENGILPSLIPSNAKKDHEGRNVAEIKDTSCAANDWRQCGYDGLQGHKNDDEKVLEFSQEESATKDLGSSSTCIWVGMHTVRYFDGKTYKWVRISRQPNIIGKVKRTLE
ncbi:uncharacterized protein LOC133788450 isoform X2 [Humulus lupulus]|uniref:uncharacterized protein LOC133788450 isoform X2 n=1 Tax=Humulus lupulus TaxID=3486 RepID=UPI002B400976|nr:uncharacterized protein LOC133788450 isoform X2 [Humulus lupulus]